MEKAGSQKRTKHDSYRHGIFLPDGIRPHIPHHRRDDRTDACLHTSQQLRKRSYKNERTVRMRNGGRIVAIIATSAPEIPASLYPTTIAPFTAIAPGADCAMAIKSSISSSSIQWYSSTNFFFISETITYPPPNVNALRYSVEKNSVHKADFFFHEIPSRQEYTAFRRIMKTLFAIHRKNAFKSTWHGTESPACGQIPADFLRLSFSCKTKKPFLSE